MRAPIPDELRRIAIDVATDAAAFVAHARNTEMLAATTTTKSTPTDMVTAVDRASEARIVADLYARRPGDGVLAEEGSVAQTRTGVTWVIDPIDGTTNFVYGYPATAVSVAAVDDEHASIAGAVVDIGRGEVFSAARGAGAFLDDATLSLPGGPADLARALISTGFSYRPETRVEQAAVLARLLPVVRDIRRGGSAALDFCWAAAGRVDAYYERGTAPWDRAAGMLIAQEAGLRGEVVGDLVWVAHPRIADDLLALVCSR
ncbi:MAG TPA: inositol monophosphatase family protein [Acidimicrobiales bacterium]|nr:inositol monophosphatase family protein [Acidimicrobiales bacterium]